MIKVRPSLNLCTSEWELFIASLHVYAILLFPPCHVCLPSFLSYLFLSFYLPIHLFLSFIFSNPIFSCLPFHLSIYTVFSFHISSSSHFSDFLFHLEHLPQYRLIEACYDKICHSMLAAHLLNLRLFSGISFSISSFLSKNTAITPNAIIGSMPNQTAIEMCIY